MSLRFRLGHTVNVEKQRAATHKMCEAKWVWELLNLGPQCEWQTAGHVAQGCFIAGAPKIATRASMEFLWRNHDLATPTRGSEDAD